jgi:Ca2+-binding RTX toxin-like protein
MLISSYERGDTPEFTLLRNGNEVTANLYYYLNEIDDGGPWRGGMTANISTYGDSVDNEGNDRNLNIEIIATLAQDTTTSGSYVVQDQSDDVLLERQFTVTLFSAAGNFLATANADYVFGSAAGDTFRSSGAFDSFDRGPDVFEGGAGNDLYRIYSADTKVFEDAGGGMDRIAAGVSYVLAAGVAIEQLTTNGATGTSSINLTGNSLAQTIYGNAGANVLNGKGGADRMQGFAGNDTYYVDNADDFIVEADGQGTDIIAATVSYAMWDGLAVETLRTTSNAGTAALNLTGNEFAQTIVGNAGRNVLDTGGGEESDVLYGLGGNDAYVVHNRDDVIVERAGEGDADRVIVSTVRYDLAADAYVEIMIAEGEYFAFPDARVMKGNDLAQTMIGNAINLDSIDGKGGNDILFGAGGARNTFHFSTTPGVGNIDTIRDFNAATDTINFELDIFTALGPFGSVQSGYFRANTTGQAQDANDHIIYETDTGKLFYDADGVGGVARVQVAVLTGKPTITADDFTAF